MAQLGLFDRVLPTRFARFLEFHRANPGVYHLFLKYARQAKDSGRQKYSAHAIGERIRWYHEIENRTDGFKVNDHVWPYYSRAVMLVNPEFSGFFSRRDAKFDTDDDTLLKEFQR